MPVVKTFDVHVLFDGVVSVIKGNVLGYFADPFILYDSKDSIFLAAEYYSRLKRKGDIYILKINKKSRKYKAYNVISDSNHRSYPFIFAKIVKFLFSKKVFQQNRLRYVRLIKT